MTSPACEPGVRRLLFEGKCNAGTKELLLELGAECVDSRSSWYTFFDNQAYALTKRGWWLAKIDEAWLLRVPLLVQQHTPLHRCSSCGRTVVSRPDNDVCRCGANMGDDCVVQGYLEEYTAPDEILEVSGLKDFAELLRAGKVKSVEGLLNRSEVRPFAAVRARREQFLLTLEDGPAVKIDAIELTFDTKTAENRAISDLLFYPGPSDQVALTATLIEVSAAGEGPFLSSSALASLLSKLKEKHSPTRTPSENNSSAAAAADAAAAASAADEKKTKMMKNAADAASAATGPAAVCGISEWAPFPEAVAYMRRLRPHHLSVISDPLAPFVLTG